MSQKGKSCSNANTDLRCAYTVITRCFNHLSRFIINFMARCPCPTSDYYETAFFNSNYSYCFHKLYLRGSFLSWTLERLYMVLWILHSRLK